MTDSSSDNNERRQDPRFKVSCRCWVEQDSMTLFGTVTNLSQRGLFLRTLPIINIGSDVELKLSIDHGVVIAKGEVRWRNKPVSSGATPGDMAPGLGIMLTEFDGGKELLERHIQRASLIPEPEPEY